MTTQHRKQRGRRTEAVVAAYLRDHGFPHAEQVGAGRAGSDITGLVSLAVEVKARAGFDPWAWLRQARTGAGEGQVPAVVFRPNGAGETTIGQWGVLLDLDTFVQLARDAGHGEPGRSCAER